MKPTREKVEHHRQMHETLLPGGIQNEDIVQVEDRPNSPHVEEGLRRLRHHPENERSQAKAEWKNHVLVEEASPTEELNKRC